MTVYKLYTRDASAWNPGVDTALASDIDRSGTALTVTQHDETHKYLYTKIVNLKFSDIDEDIDVAPAPKDILVYDGSNWANVPTSGDADIATTGAVTVSKIGGKTVTLGGSLITSGGAYNLEFDLAASVVITMPIIDATLLTTKLADGTIWIGDGKGTIFPRTPSGDLTMDNLGEFTIAATSVENSMLAGSIAWTKLATGAASVVSVTTGGGVLTTSAITTTQLEYLGVTPGTLSNSKALVVGAAGQINALTITAVDINSGTIDNVTIGTSTACTQLVVDNIDVNLNTISTTAGNLNLTPFAGSAVVIDSTVSIDNGTFTSSVDMTFSTAGDSLVLGGGILDKIGFFGSAGTVQSTGWTATNVTQDKTIDCDAVTFDQPGIDLLADVIGTVITELLAKNLIGA